MTVTLSDGTVAELYPGSSGVPLTFENRRQYLSLAIQTRLHEASQQVAAIRRGMGMVVPLHLLSLFTWQELEVAVCGEKTIDIELLKRHTKYNKPLALVSFHV